MNNTVWLRRPVKLTSGFTTYKHKLLLYTPFVWEWALEWDQKTHIQGESPTVRHNTMLFKSREKLRAHRRWIEQSAATSNFTVKRRLVQKRWETYVDSFTYSAKGNSNGR